MVVDYEKNSAYPLAEKKGLHEEHKNRMEGSSYSAEKGLRMDETTKGDK